MSKNQYKKQTWSFMLKEYKREIQFDINEYYKILSKKIPSFIDKYVQLGIMQRLKGIGLLCGTDWTSLYKNRFYYSRLDHSIGTALIVWNFTKDKKQTLAALFHDISTPVFSHVYDFKNGDALTQTSAENLTEFFIRKDKELCSLLERDNIKIEDVCDYHIYSVADNDLPRLSADRLEYMFPSGSSLQGSWTLEEIKNVYDDITVLINDEGKEELGFKTIEIAELYCKKFCETGHVLQLNENKLTLQLLAQVLTKAIELNIILEKDCFVLSEKEVINKFDLFCKNNKQNFKDKNIKEFILLYKTFRKMKKIKHTNKALKNYFCINISVKQRYINPLVIDKSGKVKRLSLVSEKAEKMIKDFLEYKDTDYGCVKLHK